MDRRKVLWYALDSVFVIVFLVFFFMLSGTDNNTSVWVAFGTILFAYAALIFTPFLIRKGSASADYARPLYVISFSYFNIVFLVGLAFIFIRPENPKAAILINVALLGIFLAAFIINLLANEHTADHVAVHEEEVKFTKNNSAALRLLVDTVKDKALAKKIEEACDLISSSPAKSSPSVKSIESNVMNEIAELSVMDPETESAEMMKAIESIISLTTKRNARLQLEN